MWIRFAAAGLALALANCAPRVEAISEEAIGQVQADIRRQIDLYVRAQRVPVWRIVPTAEGERRQEIDINDSELFRCGRGRISYEISQVRAELTVTNTREAGVSVGATVPLTAITTVTVGAGGNFSASNAQTLRFHLWPFRPGAGGAIPVSLPQPGSMPSDEREQLLRDIYASAPIAATLLNLRNQQVISSMWPPRSEGEPLPAPPVACFTNFDPGNPNGSPGNYYTIALTVKRGFDGKLSVGVGPVSIGGNFASSVASGNSLTVFFHQPGLEQVQVLADRVAAACKATGLSPQCAAERRALWAFIEDGRLPAPSRRAGGRRQGDGRGIAGAVRAGARDRGPATPAELSRPDTRGIGIQGLRPVE